MTHGLPERFVSGTAWTASGFVVFAAAGVLINLVVGAAYGAAALGAFNLVVAAYSLTSQVSVLGVHNSVVRHVALQREGERDERPSIVVGALALTLLLGTTVAAGLYMLAEPYSQATASPAVAVGMRLIAPALLLFSMNKVLMAALNGERRMRAFALAQMLRSTGLVGTVMVGAWQGWAAEVLPVAFTLSEGVLFVVLISARLIELPRLEPARAAIWFRTHAGFGARGFLGGLMVDANARVDVLLLGLLSDEVTVGLYSFASMFVVGLHNLMTVVKQNINPVFSARLGAGGGKEIIALVRTVRRYAYPGTLAVSLGILAFFPSLAGLLGEGASRDSTIMLAILLTGMSLAAGHLPFDAILVQAGRPGAHTLLMAAGVLTNVVLNLALIPQFGGFGAATATALALCAGAVYLEVTTRRQLRIPLTAGRRSLPG